MFGACYTNIKNIELILDYYSLSASGFADKIEVQRSSLSHLLSGRNKPSLDFILKIIAVFPEVDLYWILNGIGNFPKSEINKTQHKCVVSNQTTVYYKFDNKTISVLAVFDTRQNPNKIKKIK